MHLGNQTQITNDVANLMCDFPRPQRKENVQMKDAKSVFARSLALALGLARTVKSH